jgi:hypothetical protein
LLDRGRSGHVSPARVAQRFRPRIAGRDIGRRNFSFPKRIFDD